MQPRIAPNTGNIGRLCVATGAALHLVRPLGFVLSDRQLRRSAMDYWPRLNLTVHDDELTFLTHMDAALAGGGRPWLFTSKSQRTLWDVDQVTFSSADWLVFGSETSGLGPQTLQRYPHRDVRIPQVTGERCLNLAAATSVALYEALRQLQVPSQPH